MGTDIHLFVEKRFGNHWQGLVGENPEIRHQLRMADYALENGNQEKADQYRQYAADIASGRAAVGATTAYEREWFSPTVFEGWLYSGRNYDLFAILGNVRNGYGFAGVNTSDGFNFISDCRGLPEDVSSDIQDAFSDDGYYHSVSYVTLPELLDYDWGQTVTKHGVVNLEGYKDYLINGSPRSYSGGVSGPSVVHITNKEMDDIITGEHPVEEGKSYYTRVSWARTYKECVGSFYDDAIPKLKKLSDEKDYSDIRIVFGFDS